MSAVDTDLPVVLLVDWFLERNPIGWTGEDALSAVNPYTVLVQQLR